MSTTNRPITDSEKFGGKLGVRHQSPTIQESVTDEEIALGREKVAVFRLLLGD